MILDYLNWQQWKEGHAQSVEHLRINYIDYELITRTDGWLTICEVPRNGGSVNVIIEAADRAHAFAYMAKREPVRVPHLQKLV